MRFPNTLSWNTHFFHKNFSDADFSVIAGGRLVIKIFACVPNHNNIITFDCIFCEQNVVTGSYGAVNGGTFLLLELSCL